MFEPFTAASQNAKILHVLLLLFVFMTWVSTLVTFSAPLANFEFETIYSTVPPIVFRDKFTIYWNKITGNGVDHPNGVTISSFVGGGCKSGSDATLAFAVFAFFLSLVHFNLLFARMGGWTLPGVRDTHHSITLELLLSMMTWFCFFIQVCVWGGSCYTKLREEGNIHHLNPTGFSYMLACFFFLLFTIGAYIRMRQNPDLALGNGSNKAGSSNVSYSDPESHGTTSEEAGGYSYQGSAAL